MKKAKIIQETIGEALEPEGFVYDKELEDWGFIKEYKNSKDEIARQTVKFWTSRYEKKIYMGIDCFSGGMHTYGLNQFVPGRTNDGLCYSTEEEFKRVIETYADILRQYGLNFLKEIAEPKQSIYFREEDAYKLFEEHESLAEKFITDRQIDMDSTTIEDAVKLLKEMVSEKQPEPFEVCREQILEMAAFYGEVVGKIYPCRWIMYDMRIHAICELEVDLKSKQYLFVSNEIYLAWKNGVSLLDSLII